MSIQTAADQQIASLKNLSAIFSIAIFHLHAYRASAAPGGGSAQLSPYAPIMPHTAPIPHHNRIQIRHQIYANISPMLSRYCPNLDPFQSQTADR